MFLSPQHTWLGQQMGYSIFYPYKGMGDQIFKNQYTLERMVVWLISPLKFNLRQFNPSERNGNWKIDTWKFFESATPKRVNCSNLPPGKIYLNIETPKKMTIKGPPGLLHPYPCTDKKWNSPMWTLGFWKCENFEYIRRHLNLL